MRKDRNPFIDERGARRVLLGVLLYSGSPRVAEFAAWTGFDTVWIDMEHASHDWRDAEAMCVAVEAGGGVPLVRPMGSDRDHVLRALEIGAKIVVVPMVNDAATARRVARWGKYRPVGERGFFKYSRGLRYGENAEWMKHANADTVLLAQIETCEAVANLDEILAVDGVDGALVGPGDLSADMGKPGAFDDAAFRQAVVGCLRTIREAGKRAAFMAPTESLATLALDAAAELVVFADDLSALRALWTADLERFRSAAARQSK